MDALCGADVERFFKKGILERSLDDCCGDPEDNDDTDDAAESLLCELASDADDASDPISEIVGSSVPLISPKCCSANFTASS